MSYHIACIAIYIIMYPVVFPYEYAHGYSYGRVIYESEAKS